MSGKITHTEKQVIQLIKKGCTNNEIAELLNIELSTVKTHINHILKKLELKNRVQIAISETSVYESKAKDNETFV